MSAPVLTNFKALILAGGKGTRLRPLTYSMAKQLVPVANKPILHYAMDSLYEAGIRQFGIIISPETGEAIKASLALWAKHATDKVTIDYILQDEPAGLAHAVKIAQPYLGDSPFIMYLGDNLINGQLRTLVDQFSNTAGSDALILLKQVSNPSSFGVAELNEHQQVIRLVEKPKEPKSNLALVGVYLFTKTIFDAIEQIKPSGRGELEITDAIQHLITHGKQVLSNVHDGWWLDTGKKDDLLAANQIVLEAFTQSKSNGEVSANSTITGTVEVGEGSVITGSQITGPVKIGRNCVITQAVIGANTSIGEGCHVENSTLGNSVLLENCMIRNVPGNIDHSLMGQGCQIVKQPESKETHQFLLADHSEILVV